MNTSRFVLSGIILSLIMCFQLGAFAEQSEKKLTTKTIKSSGCVEALDLDGCPVVLKDLKDKKEYALFIGSGKRPTVNTAISFEGTLHNGPTACMHGTSVDVIKWTALKMRCPVQSSTSSK